MEKAGDEGLFARVEGDVRPLEREGDGESRGKSRGDTTPIRVVSFCVSHAATTSSSIETATSTATSMPLDSCFRRNDDVERCAVLPKTALPVGARCSIPCWFMLACNMT